MEVWSIYVQTKEKGGRVKISSAYSLVARGAPADGDGIPISVGEAIDTHSLYQRLPDHLRRAVWVWYCEAGTIGEKAAALSIGRNTLPARVRAAKYKLEDLHIARRNSKSKSSGPSGQKL